MAYDKSKGGDQQQQQERRPKAIACNKAMEIAADESASTEALASLANHLAFPADGCTCFSELLKGYRIFLSAVKSAEETPKPKEEGKQEPAKEEPKKDKKGGFLQALDEAGKKIFG